MGAPHHAGVRPAEPSSAQGRIPSLDGLRGMAILMVLLGHSVTGIHEAGLPGSDAITSLRFGTMGVAVFFVLSGFLITALLMREKAKRGAISLRDFYIRRVFRIIPAYYVFLTLVVIAARMGRLDLPHSAVLPAYTFTWNYSPHAEGWLFGHAWTLSMEEQFYILWPAVVALLSLRRTSMVAIAIIVLSPAIRVATYFACPSLRGLTGSMLHTHGDALMFGAILALLWDSEKFQKAMDWCFARRLHVVAVVLLLVDEEVMFQLRGGFALPIGMTLESACIALFLVWAVRFPDTAAGKFLNWKPLTFVGTISYSLYLWQQVCFRPGTRWPLSIGLAVLAALASYNLVERPFFRLRDLVIRYVHAARHQPTIALPPGEASG
jgi:peptidoglycan/LPS O-acetylase OafA/YrhL